jgi:hypothetical protein
MQTSGIAPICRTASHPYSIPLVDDSYVLTMDEISNCGYNKAFRKGWQFPKVSLVSYTNGTAIFSNTAGGVSYTLVITITPNQLQVTCSCGTPVEKLCMHAFMALDRLLYYDVSTGYFAAFAPNGVLELAMRHKKYFEADRDFPWTRFNPIKQLGTVYNIVEALTGYSVHDVLQLPAAPVPQTNDTTICYLFMIPRRSEVLPFLLPCTGKRSKGGDTVKSFDNFLSGTGKEYEPFLTAGQKTLNAVCFKLWQLVQKLPGRLIHENMLFDEPGELLAAFELWQQAITLLQSQLVYSYPYYQEKYLKKRPIRSWTSGISFRHEQPQLRFLLISKEAFYQLELQIIINQKPVKEYETNVFFIEDLTGGGMYMFASVRDAAVAEWMECSGRRMTIFREHFQSFNDNFLKPLQKHYSIKTMGKTAVSKK